jgi:hypothetical protein
MRAFPGHLAFSLPPSRGSVRDMEGGIGILLLVIILVVAVVGGVALYLTGGALWAKQTSDDGGEGGQERRPRHKAPRDPAQERTHFVGTPDGDEAMRRDR